MFNRSRLPAVALLLTCALAPACSVLATEVRLQLPGGIDYLRIRKLDKGESPMTRVYVQMLGIGDKTDAKLLITPKAGSSVGTSDQITRKFADKITSTNRFEVFTDATTGVRDKSDIVVEGMIVSAMQDIEDFTAIRKSVTTLRLSINIIDTQSGKVALARTVSGLYGNAPGEGTVLVRSSDAQQPANQDRLTNDFERALQEALENAAALLERRYRPIGKVVQVQGEDLAIFGGTEHGFKNGDHLIALRGSFVEQNGRKVPGIMKPVSVVRCDSVSDQNSQCSIIRKGPAGETVQAGDYVLLADESMRLITR